MKFLLTLITLTAGLVAAQDLLEIPDCARPCVADAAAEATTCSSDDYKCWCTADNQSAIVQAGEECVLANCGADFAVNEVVPALEKFCEEANAS